MKKLFTTFAVTALSLSIGFGADKFDKQAAIRKIDALVQTGLKKHDMERGAEIEDTTFLRRAYLDIAGRIPTIEESETFLGSTYERKREQLIATLLESDGHVSHSYNFWADVLRINHTLGHFDHRNRTGHLMGNNLFCARDALGADLAALQTEREALGSNLAALQTERDALAADVTALESERTALAADVAALVVDREALAQQLSLAEVRGERTAAQLETTADQLGDAQARATGLTDELSTLLEEQEGLQETTQAQRDALQVVRRELETTQNEIARLTGARGIYTVQPGDSLSSIATFFYRNGNRWPDILEANTNLIDAPDLIFAGMVLIVPE